MLEPSVSEEEWRIEERAAQRRILERVEERRRREERAEQRRVERRRAEELRAEQSRQRLREEQQRHDDEDTSIWAGIEEAETYGQQDVTDAHRMPSKYAGRCFFCNEWFPEGTDIYWRRDSDDRPGKACHVACYAKRKSEIDIEEEIEAAREKFQAETAINIESKIDTEEAEPEIDTEETETNTEGKSEMGIWDGVENAEIYDKGNYIKPNFIGIVEIKKTLAKQTRSAGLSFIVELEVIDTNMPEKHPVGQMVTWFQKLTDTDIAFPAVAEWAAAAAGIDPGNKKAVKEEVMPALKAAMEHATDNPTENDFVGMRVGVETVQIETKNKREFTRHTWHALPTDGD